MPIQFSKKIEPDWRSLVSCIRREGTPERVHFMELFLDPEIQDAIAKQYGLCQALSSDDPFFALKRHLEVQQFLGYDFVRPTLRGLNMPLRSATTEDAPSELTRSGGRAFVDENEGPITNWEEFESYPWPNPSEVDWSEFEWCEKNLPYGMCAVGGAGATHFAEMLTWLMGYTTCCYALMENRDLVNALKEKLDELYRPCLKQELQYDKVQIIWGSDDMGFRGGLLISPDDMREFVLVGHKWAAQMTHDAGRPYLLHACGKLDDIMEDLIEDVKIDAKHSFEDTIESVIDAKAQYGDRCSFIGGIDVDFLCRATEDEVRARVRKTLEACMPGGGYCLGSGNSVANYIPLNNYLAMMDEGRNFIP